MAASRRRRALPRVDADDTLGDYSEAALAAGFAKVVGDDITEELEDVDVDLDVDREQIEAMMEVLERKNK